MSTSDSSSSVDKVQEEEGKIRNIQNKISEQLNSPGFSKSDAQEVVKEEKTASNQIQRLNAAIRNIIGRNEEELDRIDGAISSIEQREADISGLDELDQIKDQILKVTEAIEKRIEEIKRTGQLITTLEEEELDLLQEIEELGNRSEVLQGSLDHRIKEAAVDVLKSDKKSSRKSLHLFGEEEKVAQSLGNSIEEEEKAIEIALNSIKNLQPSRNPEKLSSIQENLEKCRKRLSQGKREIENIDWNKLEKNSHSLEEVLEDGVELTGGMTNDVVSTENIPDLDSSVVKKFQRSKTQMFQAAGNLPSGEVEFPTVQDRIETEKKFRQIYEVIGEGLPVILPDIEEHNKNILRVEQIQGTPLNQYLEKSDSSAKQREMGEKLGKFVKVIHENNISITDFRINNLLVMENGKMGLVDIEYSDLDASSWQKEYMDLITLISSARQVKPEAYKNFIEGFESVYGHMGRMQKAIAAVTSKGHATLLERDKTRTKNAFKNTSNKLRGFLKS